MIPEYADYVTCCDCMRDSLVEIGSDTCSKCGTTGCLKWKDEENQEIDTSTFSEADLKDLWDTETQLKRE